MNAKERFERSVALVKRAERTYAPLFAKMKNDAEFMAGKHFKDGIGDDYDSASIRWVGQESRDVARHVIGGVTDVPMSINARPLDSGDDPDLAEQAVAILETDAENPSKEFPEVCDDVVTASVIVGLGYATLDFLEGEGRWGELYPRFLDPRCVMRDPTARSVHSPRCRFLLIRERVSLAEAKRRAGAKKGRWSPSVVSRLVPHEDNEAVRTGEVSPLLLLDRDAQDGADVRGRWADDDEVTVYYLWERNPDDLKAESVDGTFREFEPGERYLACATPECGHRSSPQAEAGDGVELPDLAECPECGGVMQRIDGTEDEQVLLAYPNGRLTILAPDAGVEKPLYEGEWPVRYRSYPVMELIYTRDPFAMIGPSLTDLNRWNQIATDMVMRLALERMMQSAPFWLMPRDSVSDWNGQPWQFSDENGWVAYYDGQAMPQVQMLEGTGIPAAWNSVYRAAKEALSSHTGVADFGLSPGQSRDIPASSVSQQIQQQEIPLAHFKRRYQRARGIFYGLWWDAIRDCYPEPRIARMRGPDGADAIKALKASDMPNYDFVLSDAPDFTALDDSKQKAVQFLIQLVQTQPPGVVQAIASEMRFPPSTVRKILASFAQAKQDAMEQAAQGMAQPMGGAQAGPPAPPTQGPGGPPPGMDSRAMVDSLLASMGPQQ